MKLILILLSILLIEGKNKPHLNNFLPNESGDG